MALPLQLGDIARRSGLDLLVLFGSRARGQQRADSDWDLAYLGRPIAGTGARSAVDVDGLLAEIVLALGSDRVDLIDLGTASGLLRYAVASEGKPVYEDRGNAFRDFQLEAARFWCDARPILDASYSAVLDGLGPG